MSVLQYLPSAQFALLVASVAVSGGLVLVADYFTNPSPPAEITTETGTSLEAGMDWQKALASIQGDNKLPTPPSAESVQNLLDAAQTDNVTETVARTLLVNLSQAKAQGLGSDIPTQEALVADALARIEPSQPLLLYTAADLKVAESGQNSLTSYGNSVVRVLDSYTNISTEETLIAVGNAIDSGDEKYLEDIAGQAAQYQALAEALVEVPVPQILSTLHLQIANNFVRIAETQTDLAVTLSDPLRGLRGIELYHSLVGETSRLFISIAQVLQNNGILFDEDEPGYAWNLLVAP